MNTISPVELKQLHDKDPSLELIDVRTPAEFRQVHVEFAHNVPLDELDPRAVMQARNGNSGHPLYVICRTGSRGKMACAKFEKNGYENVFNVEGGTTACEQAEVPVVHGKQVISLERQVRIAAGALVFIGTGLGLWHPGFLAIPAFVGAGLMFAGITDTCGMAMLLAKMPWNR